MKDLKVFAKHYYSLGLNITCISNKLNEHNFYWKNILKTPCHDWKDLFNIRQKEEDHINYQWEDATGIGCVTGTKSVLGWLTVIDIDGCNDYKLIEEILHCLELPLNYEWVVCTGSNNGFHIYVYSNKFEYLTKEDIVTTFTSNNKYKHRFEKIEILWKTHVVLPPSIHKSGYLYRFINCTYPKRGPVQVVRHYLTLLVTKYMNATEKESKTGPYGELLINFNNSNIPNNIIDFDLSKIYDKQLVCVINIEIDNLIYKNTVDEYNILQISWLILDTEGNIYKKDTELICNQHVNVNKAFHLNNLDIELVKRFGKTPQDVYTKLNKDINSVKYVVAHNTEFVLSLLSKQMKRYIMQEPISKKEQICTMVVGTRYLQTKNKREALKYPKLGELYEELFGIESPIQRNSEINAMLTAKCFREMIEYI